MDALIPSSGKSHEAWLHLAAFLSGKAPHTQVTYQGILKEWCEFLGSEIGTPAAAQKILKASYLHAIAFQQALKKRPGTQPRFTTTASTSKAVSKNTRAKKSTGLEATQSNATIAKKCAALRRMYRVLISGNIGVQQNPFDSDKAPPPPKEAGRKRPTEMVDFSLVQEIILSPARDTAVGRRDRAILGLLFGAGMRRSEVAELRIGDIRKTASGKTYLYLRSTKAKKDAEQAIPDWSVRLLQETLKDRKEMKAQSGDYVFVSFKGCKRSSASHEPISHTSIWRLFRHYCMKAGAGGHKSPHSARATAITKLLTDGIPHRLVQEFSRHASVQMVEHYDKRRMRIEDNPGLGLNFDE